MSQSAKSQPSSTAPSLTVKRLFELLQMAVGIIDYAQVQALMPQEYQVLKDALEQATTDALEEEVANLGIQMAENQEHLSAIRYHAEFVARNRTGTLSGEVALQIAGKIYELGLLLGIDTSGGGAAKMKISE